MNSFQIEKIIFHLFPLNVNFNGIYSIDNLNKVPYTFPLYIISNTAPSWTKGEHWIAIYIKNSKYGEYFDSYGRKPLNEFNKFMKSRCKYIKSNNKILQNILTATCGGYCIYYLYHKSKNYDMNEIVKKVNDYKINCFINSLYSPDDEIDLSSIIKYNQSSKRMIENI